MKDTDNCKGAGEGRREEGQRRRKGGKKGEEKKGRGGDRE